MLQQFLKILAQKYPNKAFLVPNLDISFFHKILHLDKLEGADFKYDNIFFKFQPKNIQIRHLWSTIQGIYVVFMKFCNQTNSRVLISNVAIVFLKFQSNQTNSRISNMAIVLSNYSPKIRQLGIFIPRFKDFQFAPNFATKQIGRR